MTPIVIRAYHLDACHRANNAQHLGCLEEVSWQYLNQINQEELAQY